MARIRTIKPEFFTDEDVAELSMGARIFYVGMWTQADRDGRLEDRPKRLKAVLMPYDNVNVDKFLEELTSKRFIIRYSVNNHAYIQIRTFTKHQYPHAKEAQSTIPAPDEHQTSMVQTPDEQPCVMDTGFMGLGREGVHSMISPCPKTQILEAYHQECPHLPRVQVMTDQREAHLKARWQESKERQSVEWWRHFFHAISQSDFLCGRVNGKDGRKPFRADFGWILKPENFAKILEEKYANDLRQDDDFTRL